MPDSIIKVENLSKKYHLGQTHTNLLSERVGNGLRSLYRKFRGLDHPTSAHGNGEEEFWALRDVSFEVQQGDVVGIIGRNGAGKSTLLKILSRITTPTTGNVELYGRVASLLEVGTGFHPELTGRENVYLNGAILGMSKAEIVKKFDEIVAFAEVEKFIDTPVKRYSSGMYVRLAFAVAAHLEPEILIVDEVLAVGDAQFQEKCLGKMGDVARQGRTVLFVSHNLTAVRSLCNKAFVLKQGRIIYEGDSYFATNSYISETRRKSYNREWDDLKVAPQNGSAIVSKVLVCNRSGNLMTDIYTDSELFIRIHFTVKTNASTVGLTLLVYDINNSLIFSSICNHEKNWYGKLMPAGTYTSTCRIPPNLFNNGFYRIGLIVFGNNFSDISLNEEILGLEILDGPTVRGDFYGEIGGVVRPMLEWYTNVDV